jgi:hypothetical protein
MTGRVIQIAAVATMQREVLFALTTDGEVWLRAGFDGTWRRLPDLPDIGPPTPEPTPTDEDRTFGQPHHGHDG